LQVDGIAAANITGPGATPLVVDAVGALELGRIIFTNAGGLSLNANRNLTVDGCGLPDGTAINFGGVKNAPYPAAEPGFVGKRGASARAKGATVSGNTHGAGFTVNWSGGADASGAYGFANNSGPDAGFGGQSALGAAGSLDLQSNGWGILNVGLKLSGNASLNVSGHENLTSFDFSPRLEDGNHNLQLQSNTTATFTAGLAGLGQAAFTVNQSTTNGSSNISFDTPRIAFASNGSSWSDLLFNLGASYLANPEYDLNLAGGLFGGAITVGAVDAPGGQFTLDVSELTVMGDVAFSLDWRVFVEFDNVILQGHVSAGIKGSLHKFDSFQTEYRGGLDLLFQGGSLSANIVSREDEFSEFSRILPPPVFTVSLTLTDAIFYDYGSMYIAGSQKSTGTGKDGGEVVIEGGSYTSTGSSIALQIHDLNVPVTIHGVTFVQESGQTAPLNLAELSGAITIDNCDFRGSGITINDCSGAATITNNDMIINQPMGWGVSSLSSPGATITDNTIICSSGASFAIMDSAEQGAGTISGNTVNAAASGLCIWDAGGTVNITNNEMVAGMVTIYGQALFANNTCANCDLHDLNFDGGLLADPMEASNSGLIPDMIYTHCDWDGNGCCDYPPANNERVEGVCRCEGVSPPAAGK
ncbi:MAG: right-handed parallel beta-helix repeat-containing protein, partial [bacterium]